MTLLKNTFTLVMMAAAGAYVIYAIAFMPTKTGGQLMAGPALFAFLATAVILVNSLSGPVARLTRRLRRLERNDVKRFFAMLTLWLFAFGVLIYCTLNSLHV